MTRKEEIDKLVEDIKNAPDETNMGKVIGPLYLAGYLAGVKDGVEWADKHPSLQIVDDVRWGEALLDTYENDFCTIDQQNEIIKKWIENGKKIEKS